MTAFDAATSFAIIGAWAGLTRRNHNPAVALLARQTEWTAICRTAVEHDAIAGLRLVERGLQVAARRYVDHVAGGRRFGDIDGRTREFRAVGANGRVVNGRRKCDAGRGRRRGRIVHAALDAPRSGIGTARWLDPAPHECETQNHRHCRP
jgi:hypothetical protein